MDCGVISGERFSRRARMNTSRLVGCLAVLAWSFGFAGGLSGGQSGQPLKALIVTGQSNHNWRLSTPIVMRILEDTNLFNVDIAISPDEGGNGYKMEDFRPDFAVYDVVVLNYIGEPWCERMKEAFVQYVKNGGGGAGDLYEQWRQLAGQDNWKPYQNNPIIAPGREGEWDSWAVMSMTVVKVGETFHLYYEGGLTGCGDLQVGHATSTDGLVWVKDPCNPVLQPGKTGEWDAGATWDPFVIYEDGVFKMWYGGELAGHRDFQCGYAVSKDGTHFAKKQKISNFAGGEMADMHLVHDERGGRYYMFYWDRRFDTAERLRLALSDNETDFDFANSVSLRIAGEEPGHRYTHVFKDKDTWYMYYGFDGGPARSGYATSSDLLHWKAPNTHLAETEDAEVLKVGDELYFMFYCPAGLQDEAGCDIRLAIYSGSLDGLASED